MFGGDAAGSCTEIFQISLFTQILPELCYVAQALYLCKN